MEFLDSGDALSQMHWHTVKFGTVLSQTLLLTYFQTLYIYISLTNAHFCGSPGASLKLAFSRPHSYFTPILLLCDQSPCQAEAIDFRY